MSVYGGYTSAAVGSQAEDRRLTEENTALKQKLAHVEEQLFYMQADALTTEVEAVHAASTKTKALESQLNFKDQEIKRLKQELLTLSKRETATRSAHKLETPLPAAAKMADDSLPHNCLLPYTTHDTITSLPSGVFTSSNGAPTLPPRSERPAVLSSSKCIDKHEQLFNATKLLQPEPICRVDYSALVAVMFPICQRIHGTLSAILIDCKTSTDCSLSNSKSSRSDLECNSCKMSTNQVASALVSTSANLPQQTASSRRSDIGRACPLYDTPLSAVSSMQPPSESSKHQTDAHGLSSFGQHDSKILSEISVLAIATIDDLVTAVSTSVLCTTKLIQCIRSISVVLCEAVIPLWHQLIEKCMNNKIWKDNAEIAKFCNSLHALENLLEDGLSLIETCASTFEAVIWSDYDQAFCNYCVAYQKYNASCGRLMINETDVVYTEDLGSRTKSGGNSHVRIVTPSSTHNFGGSDNLNERKNENKRPMSKPSSPLAKKLFRSDSTSPASTRGINFDAPTHSSVDGAMDWELFDENEAKTSISLVLTNNLESAEQISRLVKNISYRMLLVDPSRLMFYNQPTSSDNLLDKPIDRKMLHRSAQETIRLTNRLKCVTKHINSRFVGLSEPNEFNTSSNNSTTDLSSDIISTIRRVVAFVQMHRRFLATKPQLAVVLQNKSKKSFGVHIENRVAKVIQSICDGSHHALMTNSSAANLFSAVSLNDDWVKKGYGPCNTSLNRTKPAGRSIIVNTGIYIANGSKGDLKGSWAPKHASIEYLEVFNVLSLLAGKSLNWDNQRILLSSLTAVLLQYEGAFEALTQMHCQIQGYDTNLSNFKSIYVTGLATGKDTFAHATLGLSSENRDELYPVRESVGIINDIGVMSSVKCPTVTEGRSVSLITILLRYFISIDMKDNQSFDSNVRNTGDDFGCSNDNPAFFQLMIIDLLVQLLSKYKSRAVPIVLGIDLTSVVNSRPVQSAYSMQPTSTPGKSAVFDSPSGGLHILGPTQSRPNGRKQGRSSVVQMSPLRLEINTSGTRQHSTNINRSETYVRSQAFDEGPGIESVSAKFMALPKFNTEIYSSAIYSDVLVQLMRTWVDGITIMDSAPENLEPRSYFFNISQICLCIPILFELLAKHTYPSLKELAHQCGIYGQMQCIIYRIWTNRVHPTIRGSRNQAGFLGSLFS